MATLYWYGGSGNWSDYTNHWSNNSGNSPASPASAVPTSADNVVFDANSNANAYTCTVDVTSNCADLTLGNPTTKVLTFTGSSTYSINIYGSLSASTGVINTCNCSFIFKATSGTKTLTTNGVFFGSVTFNGIGGTFQLLDDLTISRYNNTGILTLNNGTFDANGNAVIFNGDNACSSWYISGIFTFYDLTVSPSLSFTSSIFYSYSNITVEGTVNLNGVSVTNRLFVHSGTTGTNINITSAVVSLSNVDFMDITGAGAGTWSGTSIGNAGGNSGITFTDAVTRYWVATSGGEWHATTSWSDETGGSSGFSVPLCHDIAVFDSNSITSGSRTITLNQFLMPTLNLSNVLNTPNITLADNIAIFGNLDLSNTGTLTHDGWVMYFYGRGVQTIKTAGKTIGNSSGYTVISCLGGSYTLLDDYTGANGLSIALGTLDFNDKNVSVTKIQISSSGVLYMGSGTITLTNTTATNVWIINTGCVVYAETSTIKITSSGTATQSFYGGSSTYNNIWITGSGNYQTNIYNSNQFNDFKVDTGPKTIKFGSGTTTDVSTFTVNGTAGNLITIGSTLTPTHKIVKSTPGTIQCNYLDISYSVCDPANTFYAGGTSTNSGNNTNWYFYNVPTAKSLSTTLNMSASLKDNVSKSLTSSETLSPSISKHPQLPFSETEDLVDSNFSSEFNAKKDISELLNIVEADAKDTVKSISDLSSLIEQLYSKYDLLLSANSNPSLSDSLYKDNVLKKIDDLSFQELNIKDISKNISESLSLSAELLVVSIIVRAFSDSFSLEDLKTFENLFYITKSDSVSFSESAEFDGVRYFDLSSALDLIDSSIRLPESRKIEVINILEQFSREANTLLNLNGSISLTELCSKLFLSETKRESLSFIESNTKQINKIETELFDISEDSEKLSEFKRTLTDSLFLTEYLSKEMSIEPQDAFLLVENMIYTSVFNKDLQTSLDLTEFKLFDVSKKLNQFLTIAELISNRLSLNKQENFTLTDFKTLGLNIKKSELIALNETLNSIRTSLLNIDDNLDISEVIKKIASFNINDNLLISESISKKIDLKNTSSFDIVDSTIYSKATTILSNILFTDSLIKSAELRQIYDLLSVYSSLFKETRLNKGETLVIAETFDKNSEKKLLDSELLSSQISKELSIDLIANSTFADESSQIFIFNHPETENISFNEIHTYLKSEKYLRKIYLLSKRGKSILLVRSD